MKFFRQTKETKRKLSFFMALAMVISLLPVSPVAKAASTNPNEVKVSISCNVSGASLGTVTTGSSVSGTAIIKVVANEKCEFAEKTDVKVTSSAAVNSESDKSVTVAAIDGQENVEIINELSSDKKTITVTVTGIKNSISLTLDGEAKLTSSGNTPGEGDKPVIEKEFEVSLKDEGFNYNDINLVPPTGLSSSSAIKVKENGSIKFTVEPKSKDATTTWNLLPTLTSNGKEIDWVLVSGKKYEATVPITEKTVISITGGKVVTVKATDEIGESKVDAAAKEEIGEVTIKTEGDKSLVNDVVKSIATGTSIIINGKEVEADEDIVNQIITALGKEGTNITTSLNVNKIVDNEAVSDANNQIKNAEDFTNETTNIEDADIDATVDKMMARTDNVVLDITLLSTIKVSNTTSASISVKELDNKIEITMDKPKTLNSANEKGTYYAIRIHNGKITIIECTQNGDKISFKSDRFSTYVISFVPAAGEDKPTTKPPTGGGSGIGSYVPSNSATPAPSATAAPSASPSADPSAAPGTDSSAAPTESGAPAPGGDTTPTKAPAATDKPVDTDKDNTTGGSTAVKVGKKATVSGSQYKVTAVKGTRTVQFTKGKKNAKSIVVPSTVKISGKNYKVTTIAKNAFKGNKKLAKVTIGKNVNKIGVSAFQNCSKLKSIIIKSTKLTAKKVGKNAFKGINKKATFKVPKSKVKAYKKIVKAKGAGKNVKVKK